MLIDEVEQARELEEAADAAVAAGRPARAMYVQAQVLITPNGRNSNTREEYDRRMEWFSRIQDKLYAVPAEYDVVSSQPAPPRQHAEAPPEPAWRKLAAERRFAEAVELLRPSSNGLGGMGYYAAQGYAAEEMASQAASNGDAAMARTNFERALEFYLLYSLYPARGDSEEYGYELAAAVLEKLKRL